MARKYNVSTFLFSRRRTRLLFFLVVFATGVAMVINTLFAVTVTRSISIRPQKERELLSVLADDAADDAAEVQRHSAKTPTTTEYIPILDVVVGIFDNPKDYQYPGLESDVENDTKAEVKPAPADDHVVGEGVGVLEALSKLEPMSGEKYIIFLCDKVAECSVLGNWQRAIASLYLLALVTGRKFGVNMTDSVHLTKAYEPYQVPWLLPMDELRGKTSKVLTVIDNTALPLETIDFNQKYPEDVVYIRTNVNMISSLRRNRLYRTRLPKVAPSYLFPLAWIKLMSPTRLLRNEVNGILKNVSVAMEDEFTAVHKFDFEKCDKSCNYTNLDTCTKKYAGHSHTAMVLADGTPNYCRVSPPQLRPKSSPAILTSLYGYQTSDLDLVCAQIIMGRFNNNLSSLRVVLTFLRGYVDRGHHVFLASDSEIKARVKAEFGYRVHFSGQPSDHLGPVKESDSPHGFLSPYTTQLLMSTSCKVLVMSYSSTSMKAGMIRSFINSDKDLYLFKNDKITSIHANRLF